MRHKS